MTATADGLDVIDYIASLEETVLKLTSELAQVLGERDLYHQRWTEAATRVDDLGGIVHHRDGLLRELGVNIVYLDTGWEIQS